jgi:hypothetical protein
MPGSILDRFFLVGPEPSQGRVKRETFYERDEHAEDNEKPAAVEKSAQRYYQFYASFAHFN